MDRRQLVAVGVVAALALWSVATLGFRAIWADVACGGAICDQMRADVAAGRHLLVIAWAIGMVVGAAVLLVLWRYRRSA